MKSPTLLDCPDSGKNKWKHIQVLADGTRVTECKKSQTCLDGSVMTKTRVARTYPCAESDESPLIEKEIKTTIIRMDPDEQVHTTTAIEETITAPRKTGNSSKYDHGISNIETKTYTHADGSGILATKSISILSNGSVSTVITKVHMNHIDRNPFSDETHQRHPVEYTKHDTRTPYGDVLPPSQPPLPPGHKCLRKHVQGKKLETAKTSPSNGIQESFPNSTLVETLRFDDQVVLPAQCEVDKKATIPDVKLFPYSHSVSQDKSNLSRDGAYMKAACGLESLSSGSEEPARTTALAHDIGKFEKDVGKLTSIDCCDVNYTAQSVTIMTLKLDDEPEEKDRTKVRTLDDTMQQIEDSRETGRIEPASHFTPNNNKLAVATAIDASEEEPIYKATNYTPESNSTIDRTRIITCMIVALVLLIGSVAGAVVHVTTIRRKTAQETPHVPSVSPTSTRNSIIPQVIQRDVLKRNISLSNLAFSDPLIMALHWVLHEDEMKLEATDPKLPQRFTLALLGFQFDYLAWSNNYTQTDRSSDWLTSEDECEWFGVKCVDGKISTLNLASNNLIGEIPPEIGNLLMLESLVLKDNCVMGTLPLELGLLSNLEHIDLSHNGLSGFVPDEFFSLTSLSRIIFDCQRYIGYYCPQINCSSSDGSVIDPQVDDSSNVDKIGLEGKFLEKIGLLQELKHVSLLGNSFSGSIAPDIVNLKYLEYLDADHSNLNGTIPDELFTLSNLRELWFQSNDFSGTLPNNIGEAKNIENIWFWVESDGRMNGTIPDSLYNLTQLSMLSLSGHSFEGEIKTDIGNLKNLTQLLLDDNEFTGTLPSELGLCEKLVVIRIQHTNIQGTVPNEVCTLRSNLNLDEYGQFYADCAPENGTAFLKCDEDCCSTCCEHTSKVCVDSEDM